MTRSRRRPVGRTPLMLGLASAAFSLGLLVTLLVTLRVSS